MEKETITYYELAMPVSNTLPLSCYQQKVLDVMNAEGFEEYSNYLSLEDAIDKVQKYIDICMIECPTLDVAVHEYESDGRMWFYLYTNSERKFGYGVASITIQRKQFHYYK